MLGLPSRLVSPTTIILLVLVASIGISLGLAALIVRRGRSQAEKALGEISGRQRTIAATALGRTDPEDRGNLLSTGTLVLGADELAFAQWRPQRVLRVPRSSIVVVDSTKEHLGKTMRTDVLRITWREDGTEASIAFFVRDLDAWLQDLGGRPSEPPPGT